jgi:hypothetical protein
MPLPFAPPPEDSNLYQQLESTTLNTLTPDQLDTIRAKTFSQGTEGNEDEYRRLLLLGLAADKLSVSGPMPQTGVIKNVSITSNTIFEIFRPNEGEVYVLCGAELEETAGTATKAGILSLYDGAQTVRLIYEATGGETEFEPVPHQIYIDHDMWLVFDASSGFSAGETADIHCGFIRVR